MENYNREVGFEKSNVASPDRIICDYFMYPRLQIPQIYDFMEEYGDSINWDFSSTYLMMDKFGLDRGLLDKLIEETKMTISGNRVQIVLITNNNKKERVELSTLLWYTDSRSYIRR